MKYIYSAVAGISLFTTISVAISINNNEDFILKALFGWLNGGLFVLNVVNAIKYQKK